MDIEKAKTDHDNSAVTKYTLYMQSNSHNNILLYQSEINTTNNILNTETFVINSCAYKIYSM